MCFLSVTARAHLPGPPQKSKTARVVTNSKAPDFTLVNQNGAAFHSDSARGRVILVTFVFTTCPDVCPLLTAKFAQLQRMLAREQPSDFFLISITTDPEVDKPEVLKSYAQRYGADLSTWAFLTGEEDTISKVWRSFGVSVKKKGKGLMQHTSLTTLIDRQGVRRINYYGDSWQEKDIFQDIQTLRQPATGGKIRLPLALIRSRSRPVVARTRTADTMRAVAIDDFPTRGILVGFTKSRAGQHRSFHIEFNERSFP